MDLGSLGPWALGIDGGDSLYISRAALRLPTILLGVVLPGLVLCTWLPSPIPMHLACEERGYGSSANNREY